MDDLKIEAPTSASINQDAQSVIIKFQEDFQAYLDSVYSYSQKEVDVIQLNGVDYDDPDFIKGMLLGMGIVANQSAKYLAKLQLSESAQ